MTWHVLHLLGFVGIVSCLAAEREDGESYNPQTFLKSSAKVLLLGDSNTTAGTKIPMLEAFFLQ